MTDLSGKTVMVTGGAGLLGSCFSRGIAGDGGRVIIAETDVAAAERLCAEIRGQHGADSAHPMVMDITDPDSVRECMETFDSDTWLDGLVNNAYPRNSHYGRPFDEVEYADFCENISSHLGGYFLVAQAASKQMRRQGRGVIINMASIYGVVAPRFEVYQGTQMTMPVEYAVIKAGVVQFTRYLAAFLKGSGVRVNSISPGGIHDNQPEGFVKAYKMHCLDKGMLDTSDILGTLLFLLSDAAIYINGQNLIVDDGFTL